MVSDKDKFDAVRNGRDKDTMIHRNGQTHKRPAFMNPKALGKLPRCVTGNKRIDCLPAFGLQIFRQIFELPVEALGKFYNHFLPESLSR